MTLSTKTLPSPALRGAWPQRIGAVFANGLGDAVLTLPAIRALKAAAPDARIVAPLSPQLRVIFDEYSADLSDLDFDGGREFSPPGLRALLSDAEVVGFFTSWTNASLSSWLGQTADGVSSWGLSPPFGARAVHAAGHYFDRYFAITQAITGFGELERYAYPHRASAWAAFEPLGARLAELGEYWVLHPDTKPWKTLPKLFWRRLIDRILALRSDVTVVVIGKDHGDFVEKAHHGERVILVPSNFSLSTYLLSHAKRFCGVDSCFLHYADLQRVPSVALFRGGADVTRWGLRLTPHRATIEIGEAEDPDPEAIAARLVNLC